MTKAELIERIAMEAVAMKAGAEKAINAFTACHKGIEKKVAS